MKKFLFSVFVLIAFSACGKDDDQRVEIVEGPDSLFIYADETERIEGIRFTATSDWTTHNVPPGVALQMPQSEWSNKEIGGSEAFGVGYYKGGAGTYAVTFEPEVNYSGHTRYDGITIYCGKSKVGITLEQDGKTESGEVPELPESEY
jgi:hypothetical protein